MAVELSTTTFVAGAEPKWTAAPVANPVLEMVMEVPPAVEPVGGDTAVTVGVHRTDASWLRVSISVTAVTTVQPSIVFGFRFALCIGYREGGAVWRVPLQSLV